MPDEDNNFGGILDNDDVTCNPRIFPPFLLFLIDLNCFICFLVIKENEIFYDLDLNCCSRRLCVDRMLTSALRLFDRKCKHSASSLFTINKFRHVHAVPYICTSTYCL